MDLPLSKIDELLSGMLDGILSDQELRELKSAMDADSSLNDRLEELASLRRSLLRGRKSGHLGSEFATRVTQGAMAEAEKMGSEAPAWLVPDGKSRTEKPLPTTTLPPAPPSFRPIYYSLALATAAIFSIIFMVLPNRKDDLGQLPLVSNVPAEQPNEPPVLVEDKGINPSGTDPVSPEKLESDRTLIADNPTNVQPENVGDAKLDPDPNSSLVENPIPNDSASVEGEREMPSKQSNSNLVAAEPPRKQDTLSKFTMVIDVSMDRVAIENRVLESILNKYNIVFTNDFELSGEQVVALEDSGLVKGAVPEDTENEKIGFLFLKGKGPKLSAAMMEVFAQYKDFPEISVGMTTAPLAPLVEQLSSIQVADGEEGVAQRLNRNNSLFTATRPKQPAIPKNIRTQTVKSLFGNVDSNILLIVREAK